MTVTGPGIREARRSIADGSLTASALMKECMSEIRKHAQRLNAFASHLDEATLLEQADLVDRRRAAGEHLPLLAGIPIAVKDIYATADLPTTASSKVLEGHMTTYDAVSVTRLRDAGAIVVGKTHTHEFAYGPSTANEYVGPSRNPWNTEHVPGGSSGGSAIAVAIGMALGATGSDTGGSIRHPSAFCGTSGLKPTYGLVSRRGILPLSWSLDHAGPMARSVDDLAFLLQAMAGFDEEDAGSVEVDIPDYVSGIAKEPGPLRIGIPKEHFFDVLDPEVRAAFDAALDDFRSLGWTIEPVSLPHMKYALGAELGIISAEASAYHRNMLRDRANDVSRNVLRQLDAGMVLTATDYLLGQRARQLIIRDFAAAFEIVDILATPSVPILAPRLDQKSVEIEGKSFSVLDAVWRNAYPTNLSGSPTLCMPCGFSRSGFPIGLQMIGRNFAELALLQAGKAYQDITSWHLQLPSLK